MTPEQMEQAIEFIVNSQAQSEIRQARNDEQISKLGERIGQLSVTVDQLANQMAIGFERLTEAQAQTARDISVLTKRVDRTSAEVETMSLHVREFIAEMRGRQ